MERLCDLYFELSNEDRLKILYKLGESNLNMSALARELEMSTQECSRHTSRLSDALLVEKEPEGFYRLTNYGRSILRLVPGQQFIAEHRDYFNAHTLETLPSEFVSRVGELQESSLTPSVVVTFNLIESLFENAKEYVWVMHDRYLMNILPLSADALRRGVKFRTLDTPPKEPDRGIDPARPSYITEADEELFVEAWQDGKIDARNYETIDIFLYVSEREAVIAFPLGNGSFDYLGFYSGDQAMLRYCRDLFDFYYEKGDVPSGDLVYEQHEKRMGYYAEKKEAT